MAIVVRYGISYMAQAQNNGIRWVENPGDAAVFPDATSATNYLSAAGFNPQVELVVVTGTADDALRTV